MVRFHVRRDTYWGIFRGVDLATDYAADERIERVLRDAKEEHYIPLNGTASLSSSADNSELTRRCFQNGYAA
jgi:hypothetical protein